MSAVILLILLFAFLAIGVPVAFALGVTSIIGILAFEGIGSLTAVADIAWQTTSEFLLVAIPLFVLMSELIGKSGVGRDLFRGVDRWLRGLPGGIAMSSVVASAIFGAVSGTAVGVAAVMGGIAVPEMLQRNYSKKVAAGTVAASSGLGMIIPPSLPLIIYGVTTETSIATLFAKAIIPGIIITLIFCIYIFFAVLRQSKSGHVVISSGSDLSLGRALMLAAPTLVLIVVVLGSIYKGIATPTEAAAVGVFGSIALAAMKKSLTWKMMYDSINSSTRISIMLLAILVMAMLFSYMLSSAQVPQMLSEAVTEASISRMVFFALVMVLLFILGMFLDAISVILIAVPIIAPVLVAFDFDLIWFGVILMINMCFAVITPPVGLCLYVVRDSVPNISLGDVIYGTMPFILLYILSIVLFAAFPQLILGF